MKPSTNAPIEKIVPFLYEVGGGILRPADSIKWQIKELERAIAEVERLQKWIDQDRAQLTEMVSRNYTEQEVAEARSRAALASSR